MNDAIEQMAFVAALFSLRDRARAQYQRNVWRSTSLDEALWSALWQWWAALGAPPLPLTATWCQR